MRPLALLPIAAVAASLVLAGCGGSSSSPGQTASSDTVSVKNVEPALSVIQRPAGTRQLTAGGRPLYTFAEDSAGDVTGDGAIDKFGGRSFTWHAVVAGKRTAPATTSSNQTRSGYGY